MRTFSPQDPHSNPDCEVRVGEPDRPYRKGVVVFLQSELVAALVALGVDAEVQISLDGIPLDINGLSLDERRGVIFLRPHPEKVPDALRRFVAAVIAVHDAGRQQAAVRHNARGHYARCRSIGRRRR
ncbi:hypothetical protein [Actinoplanes sp. L3-i22]|uniref:hypothetical protein n=1 Tax=Actinoplanes sp. L3-i22 TaxID=2836373 RepID=UPI001C846AEF|nr:hypothetical protein [Actinoplanes sp. L3-i22]